MNLCDHNQATFTCGNQSVTIWISAQLSVVYADRLDIVWHCRSCVTENVDRCCVCARPNKGSLPSPLP